MSQKQDSKIVEKDNKKTQYERWKENSSKSRHEAMTYVDLAKGESMKVQVLFDEDPKTEEIKSDKGDFKKVVYKVIDLKTGHKLDCRLTPRQAGKLEEEIEKLALRNFDPIVRLKKVDDKTLDIEGLPPNA